MARVLPNPLQASSFLLLLLRFLLSLLNPALSLFPLHTLALLLSSFASSLLSRRPSFPPRLLPRLLTASLLLQFLLLRYLLLLFLLLAPHAREHLVFSVTQCERALEHGFHPFIDHVIGHVTEHVIMFTGIAGPQGRPLRPCAGTPPSTPPPPPPGSCCPRPERERRSKRERERGRKEAGREGEWR
eukprot:239419-Rhodomonas_salina.1